MQDPRYHQLAKLLIHHSTRLQAEEKILIEATHIPEAMLLALIEAASDVGATPIVEIKNLRLQRTWLCSGNVQQIDARTRLLGELELARMQQMHAYIGLRGSDNITEMSDVSAENIGLFEQNLVKPVHIEQRVKHTRWCVLRWPNSSMAQQAGMSTQAFEDFYFRVCLTDYTRMEKAVQPLKDLMNHTDKVRITGADTDLSFSIKGIGAVPCCGTCNIPDGECFTAPVKNSVEGHIHFNSASIYRGTPFDNVRLTFKEGKVVASQCNNNPALEAILDSDEGARYIGEFALGFHPHIVNPMRDILFDEKIRGSLHLALGQCYEETENGNRSKVHWDLVLRQEPGGEIFFDDVLVRKDGRFVLPQLQGLNPEELAGSECL